MIFERITAIRVIPPRLTVTQVPVGRTSRTVQTVHSAGSGRRELPQGASGAILDETYEDIDVETYSPRDVVLYAPQLHVEHR